jgi:hypothetical protein
MGGCEGSEGPYAEFIAALSSARMFEEEDGGGEVWKTA